MARSKAKASGNGDSPELSANAQAVRDALLEQDVRDALVAATELDGADVLDALNELGEYGDARRALSNVSIADKTYELGEPAEGHGHVIIEAPADVVESMAALHPSEHASMATMASGRLREALIESGRHRSRRPRDAEPLPAADVAVVAGRLV